MGYRVGVRFYIYTMSARLTLAGRSPGFLCEQRCAGNCWFNLRWLCGSRYRVGTLLTVRSASSPRRRRVAPQPACGTVSLQNRALHVGEKSDEDLAAPYLTALMSRDCKSVITGLVLLRTQGNLRCARPERSTVCRVFTVLECYRYTLRSISPEVVC